MLPEFSDIIENSLLPRRRKYLHYYVVGFVDCEGCFSISVKKKDATRFGYVIDPVFTISQKKNHVRVLELIKRVLGCGRIIPKHGHEEEMMEYVVDARRQLAEKIVPFFRKHRLIVKHEEFKRFAEVVEAIGRGEHRTYEGFKNLLVKIYAFYATDRRAELEQILRDISYRAGASETTSREPHHGT